MTVGHARVAIRQMLRLSRPTRRPLWPVLAGFVVAAVSIQALGEPWSGPVAAALGAVVVVGGLFGLLGRLWGWIAIASLFGIGLGFIPLFGVLGLELSVTTAVFATIMGADVGSALARALARMPPDGVKRSTYAGRTLARGAGSAALLAMAITVIPAVIAMLRGIVVPTCDWWFGIETFVAMPLATAALAGAAGHAMGALVGPRRYLGAALAHLPTLVVAGAALVRFHQAPPVYTYNAILGYFPGNMYDENVRLGMALLWSRLEQLGWLVTILALVATRFDVASYRARIRVPRPAGTRLGAIVLAFVAAAGAITLRSQGGELGFAIDAEDMESALGARLETEHFVIYYSPTPEIIADLPLIAEDHEFRYAQVVAQLGAAPAGKLRSFYFADRDQKARLHGSRDVEMAKPWRREIYLDHRSFPHSSLRHEIAHAVASEFGDWLWGVAARRVFGLPLLVSPGLIEGLAVAVDWPAGYDRLNPHESVRVIQAMGKVPSISSLMGLAFFSVSSEQGYTTAGSFLRFLLDRYGAAKLRAVYGNGGDFDAAYGIPRSRLEGEWRAMLETIQIPEAVVKASQERFRRTSVFARPCAHAIAKRREHAFETLAEGDRAHAVALMREVCDTAPEEPRYQLELGDFLFTLGDDTERAEARTVWGALAGAETNTSSMRALAYERLARAAGSAGELDRARELVTAGRALPLDPTERRQLDAMGFALAHRGPAGDALRRYFFPPKGSSTSAIEEALAAVAAEPDLGFAHYLLGLQRTTQADWPGGAAELERALGRELPGLSFVRNAARRLAVLAYRTGDRARLAIATTTLSSSEMTSGDRLLAKDWQDRIAFDDRRSTTAAKP
jgi:hypothetical protein